MIKGDTLTGIVAVVLPAQVTSQWKESGVVID